MERIHYPNERIDWELFDKALEKAKVSMETGCELVCVSTSILNPSGFSELTGRCTSMTPRYFNIGEYDQVYASFMVECRYKEECSDCDNTSHGAAIEGICNPCAVKRGWLILE